MEGVRVLAGVFSVHFRLCQCCLDLSTLRGGRDCPARTASSANGRRQHIKVDDMVRECVRAGPVASVGGSFRGPNLDLTMSCSVIISSVRYIRVPSDPVRVSADEASQDELAGCTTRRKHLSPKRRIFKIFMQGSGVTWAQFGLHHAPPDPGLSSEGQLEVHPPREDLRHALRNWI